MNKVRNFCIIIGVVILATALFFGASLLFKKPQMSIDFSATTVAGESFSLHGNIGKTPTVLVFMDTDNEDTGYVMERINKLSGVEIIAVAINELESTELPEYVSGVHKLCLDGEAAIAAYDVSQAPVTYFIDIDGYVQDVFIGKMKQKSADKACAKITGE